MRYTRRQFTIPVGWSEGHTHVEVLSPAAVSSSAGFDRVVAADAGRRNHFGRGGRRNGR